MKNSSKYEYTSAEKFSAWITFTRTKNVTLPRFLCMYFLLHKNIYHKMHISDLFHPLSLFLTYSLTIPKLCVCMHDDDNLCTLRLIHMHARELVDLECCRCLNTFCVGRLCRYFLPIHTQNNEFDLKLS